MRYVTCLSFILLLFYCGHTTRANSTVPVRHKTGQAHTVTVVQFPLHLVKQVRVSPRKLLRVQSKVPRLWNYWHNFPQGQKIGGIGGSRSILLLNTGARDGADAFRLQFLPGINTTGSKQAATRLLQDLHAILRSLIFPQHYFW